ncbi:MAG: dimethylsulfonioproprionate lyase family protein [Pseudomonadota bacterium]
MDRLLAAAKGYHQSNSELSRFVDWPSDLQPAQRQAVLQPGCAHFKRDFPINQGDDTHSQLISAIHPIEEKLEWRTTYTEAEVGADYLARSAWFELIGPNGHFQSNQCIAFIAYWGEGLLYPWHKHEAEEIYTIVAGAACLHVDGNSDRLAEPGASQFHASWEAHALTTPASPVVTFCMWRGAGLDRDPIVLSS